MKNRYYGLIFPLTLLILTGCAVNQNKEAENCGQVNNGLLSGFSSQRVNPKDEETINNILNAYNTPKAWISTCGANIVASPSQAVFNAEKNTYCRNISIKVDAQTDNIFACISKESKWNVISSELKKKITKK